MRQVAATKNEILGDIVLKIAPLVKHRNETIHQYLKVNWQNIIVVKERIEEIKQFIHKMKEAMKD